MTDNKNESREAPATSQPDANKPAPQQQSQGDSKPDAEKPVQQK